jgi:hypothetical protein
VAVVKRDGVILSSLFSLKARGKSDVPKDRAVASSRVHGWPATARSRISSVWSQRADAAAAYLEAMVKHSLDGVVDLDYVPSGVTWRPTANALEALGSESLVRSRGLRALHISIRPHHICTSLRLR